MGLVHDWGLMIDLKIYCFNDFFRVVKSELLNKAESPDEGGPVSNESEEKEGDDSSEDDDEEFLDSYDDETIAKVAFTSVVDCVDRLIRLAAKIRKPIRF